MPPCTVSIGPIRALSKTFQSKAIKMLHVVEILLVIKAINLEVTQGIHLSSVTSCTCVGHKVIYECAVNGSGITTWGGTALQECLGERLLLRHSKYNSSYVVSTICGTNGLIIAHGISAENGTYFSQLILNVSNSTVGDSIMCSGGSEESNESAQISLSTTPPHTPTKMMLSTIDNGYITYAWNPVDYSCFGIHYFINASGCGECPNITHSNNLTCLTDMTGHQHVCTLSIQAVICGTIIGEYSNASEFIIRGYRYNGARLFTVNETDSGTQKVFLEIDTGATNIMDFILEMADDTHENSTSVALNATIYSGNPSELCCTTTIDVDLSYYGNCSQTFEISPCTCIIDTSDTLGVMVSVIGGIRNLLVKEAPTNFIHSTTFSATLYTSTSEGQQMQDFTTIIGVGSAFVFIVTALLLGIILASTAAFIKVRSNRRAKQHDFIVHENVDSSLSRDTPILNISQLPTRNIQQVMDHSAHNQVTANSIIARENKEVVYAEIGPGIIATKIIPCLDHDRVAYSEIRLPNAAADDAYDYGY